MLSIVLICVAILLCLAIIIIKMTTCRKSEPIVSVLSSNGDPSTEEAKKLYKLFGEPYAYGTCQWIPGTNCPSGSVFAGITQDNCGGWEKKTLCIKGSEPSGKYSLTPCGYMGLCPGGSDAWDTKRCPLSATGLWDGGQLICRKK